MDCRCGFCESSTPITEQRNSLTKSLDVASVEDMIGLLGQSDEQLYSHLPHHSLLLDRLAALSDAIATVFQAHHQPPPSSSSTSSSPSTSDDKATGKGVIIMSGCGTSGRIAMAIASTQNALDLSSATSPPSSSSSTSLGCFDFLLAGTASALLVPKELNEDDPNQGISDLQQLLIKHRILLPSDVSKAPSTPSASSPSSSSSSSSSSPSFPSSSLPTSGSAQPRGRAVFIGITCGLSAAYVAGQLDYAFDHPELFSTVVCVGFNPARLARTVPIERWHKTFRDVVDRFEEASTADQPAQQRLLINPIIGPESIQGSSRMKGGTMTKILLDIAIYRARSLFSKVLSSSSSPSSPSPSSPSPSSPSPSSSSLSPPPPSSSHQESILEFLLSYQQAQKKMYGNEEFRRSLGQLISFAGNSLRVDPEQPGKSQGHVYYFAISPAAGWLTMIDASECLCTYGAALTDVRCFVEGGWALFKNEELTSTLQAQTHPIFRVDTELFDWQQIKEHDTIIVVLDGAASAPQATAIVELCQRQQQQVPFHFGVLSVASHHAVTTLAASSRTALARYTLDEHHPSFVGDVIIKLALNAITTCAHILKGKVYQNQMIDLAVSNAKLFARTIAIVAEITGVSPDRARSCLLQAIYQRKSPEEQAYDEAAVSSLAISQHITNALPQSQIVPISLLLALGVASSTPHARQILLDQPIVNRHLS